MEPNTRSPGVVLPQELLSERGLSTNSGIVFVSSLLVPGSACGDGFGGFCSNITSVQKGPRCSISSPTKGSVLQQQD